MLTFIGNQLLEAGEVWAYKYTNLLIHLLAGAVLFWLAGRLLLERPELAPRRWTLALWIAAVWLLAPIQVSTVLYVVQRMAELAALFVFAGLLAYTVGRQNLASRPVLGGVLIGSSVLLWWPLATLSKENGALLLPLLLLVEIYFFGFRTPRPAARRILAGLFVVLLGIPAGVLLVKLTLHPALLLGGYASRDFTLEERLLTEGRVLFSYVRALIVPDSTTLGLYHDDYRKSTGLLSPPSTLLAAAGWLAILCSAYLFRRSSLSPVFFGVLFFLLAQSLESTFIPLEIYFEHRNYLPGFGLFFGLAALLSILIRSQPQLRRPLLLFAAALPAFYAFATYQRVQTWTSSQGIVLSAQRAHPDSSRLQADLAVYFANARNAQEALRPPAESGQTCAPLRLRRSRFGESSSCASRRARSSRPTTIRWHPTWRYPAEAIPSWRSRF